MNETMNLNNSDTDYLDWWYAEMRKPQPEPVPGDWAYGLTDPFFTPDSSDLPF